MKLVFFIGDTSRLKPCLSVILELLCILFGYTIGRTNQIAKKGSRFRMFENMVLRRILDVRGIKYQKPEENCVMGIFLVSTLHQTLFA
jgi:hypothetical protein